MFEIKNMEIYIYPRYLIKNLSLVLNKGDKLAIIGEEGNGKSTLLKAILGMCDYGTITGDINFHNNKIGYLEQVIKEEDRQKKVFDFLFFDEDDYYNKINDFYSYLATLKLDDAILKQFMKTLSGGEMVKVRFLKMLLDDVDIYFLDEPTNDLDILTLEWLEDFINQTSKPVVYISHDETLLSRTANMILHLEQVHRKSDCRHTLLKSDYDTYVSERLKSIEHQTQIARSEKREFNKKTMRLQQVMQKVEYQQRTISRSDPHGAKLLKKKMHSLKSQEKKLDNTNLTEIPDVEEGIYFTFECVSIPKKKAILNLELPFLEVGNRVLAKNIKLEVVGPEHICIIGKNGMGKTSLIKRIYEELAMRSDITLGYMAQDYEDVLGGYDNVLDFITQGKSKEEITRARMFLGNMKFTEAEMTGRIKDLSNGTKAKLILVKFVLDRCDVLLLDEPTRNVSPLSNPVIRSVLKEFKGTIISVSHDRKYLAEVVDKIYLLTENGLVEKGSEITD